MNLLEVQGLRKTYPAFRLEDVSFSVPEGAVMGLIGRNGAGKSTTLKSILGLVHPDAGRVEMFGREFSENERYIKENIGVVLGGIDFYPKKKVRTITDVTRRFYSNWQEEKYRHYLDLFAIDENKRVDQLSSGMRVKYLLALALSQKVLNGRGAWRLQGGGFAGTIQAFVPVDLLDAYKAAIDGCFGEGSCHVLNIRNYGAVPVTPDM